MFDAYSPDVLYGEVLVRPEWTQPTLNQEEIRKNGGVAPPPEPIMPTEFTIQLYNPDQQVVVRRQQPLLGSAHYDFGMPQDTFRTPSGSMLDKTQHDPAAAGTTPLVNFTWRKESKLNKDMTCFNTGKSTDVVHKRKATARKEPDIAVALFKSLKEVTVYAPNLSRIDVEDAKGLEVVLLLGATVIRDVFNGVMKQPFNISDPASARRRTSSGSPAAAAAAAGPATLVKPNQRQPSAPASNHVPAPVVGAGAASSGLYQHPTSASHQPNQPYHPNTQTSSRPPPADPRTQWEIDAETARLQAQSQAESAQLRKQEEARRRERQRQDEEESRRLRKQLDVEEKERRRRQKEIDKETERLRRIYGGQGQLQQQQGFFGRSGSGDGAGARPGAYSAPVVQGPFPNAPPQPQVQQPVYSYNPAGPYGVVPPPAQQQQQQHQVQQVQQPQRLSNGLYLAPQQAPATRPHKKSMWNLRSRSDENQGLAKKASSVW